MISAPSCSRIVTTITYSPGSLSLLLSILLASSILPGFYHRLSMQSHSPPSDAQMKIWKRSHSFCSRWDLLRASRRSQRSPKSLLECSTLLQHAYHSMRRRLNSCCTKFCTEPLENICLHFISLWKLPPFEIIFRWPNQMTITKR